MGVQAPYVVVERSQTSRRSGSTYVVRVARENIDMVGITFLSTWRVSKNYNYHRLRILIVVFSFEKTPLFSHAGAYVADQGQCLRDDLYHINASGAGRRCVYYTII